MLIKNIRLLILTCFFCTSTLQHIFAEHAPDDVFKGILRENTDFFTDPNQLVKTGSSSYESLIANAFSNSESAQHLPEVIFGSFKKAIVKMTIYSSPTCAHCAAYHENVMPGLLELCRKGDLVLVTRSFVAHMKWDVTAIKISWAKGMKHQFDLMGQILNNQKIWLLPAAYNDKDHSEKENYIKHLADEISAVSKQLSIPEDVMRKQLNIAEDDPCGLLKLFALTYMGIDFNSLVEVLNNNDMERDVLRMTLGAKDENGNLLSFTPAIYIQKHPSQNMGQGTLQERNLEVEAVEKLIIEAKKGY